MVKCKKYQYNNDTGRIYNDLEVTLWEKKTVHLYSAVTTLKSNNISKVRLDEGLTVG
jgi:hypothetical protein